MDQQQLSSDVNSIESSLSPIDDHSNVQQHAAMAFSLPTTDNGGFKKRRCTKGRQKIPLDQLIVPKSRRLAMFSKRKRGLMKKAHDLNQLCGAHIMLVIASETNHVYSYGSDRFKGLINSPGFQSMISNRLAEAAAQSPVEKSNDDTTVVYSSQIHDSSAQQSSLLTNNNNSIDLPQKASDDSPHPLQQSNVPLQFFNVDRTISTMPQLLYADGCGNGPPALDTKSHEAVQTVLATQQPQQVVSYMAAVMGSVNGASAGADTSMQSTSDQSTANLLCTSTTDDHNHQGVPPGSDVRPMQKELKVEAKVAPPIGNYCHSVPVVYHLM